MTLETKIVALAQAIGADIKDLRTKQGDLTALSTTAKSNLVSAINELYGLLGSSGAVIDDNAGDGATSVTWSADKIYDQLALKAALASPAFTGNPTAPTPAAGDNDTSIATTSFVQSAVGGFLAKSGLTGGTVTLTAAEASNVAISLSGALTSNLTIVVPGTVPRAWVFHNGTSGAFTCTVKTASGTGVLVAQGKRGFVYSDGTNVNFALDDFTSITATVAPQADGTAAVGTSSKFAKEDHRHPTDTTRAALASPAFTGIPTAPTATVGTNTQQIATTAFVQSAVAALVDGAAGTLDTLNELADALGNDPNFATTIATGLANRVRFDAAQALTVAQQLQACTNIGVGNPEHDFVTDYTTAKA